MTSPARPAGPDLSGQLILITGGNGALGRVITERLTGLGAVVAVNDLPGSQPPGLAAGQDGTAFFPADITAPGDVAALWSAVQSRFGRVPDTVCCHAGMTGSHPVTVYPPDEFDQLINLNLRGAFLLAQHAARAWQGAAVPGHLIFTTSWVSAVPWPELAPYNASKAALTQLARTMARELAADRIRANCVAPGIVDAGMARYQWDTDPGYQARAKRAIPLGYLQPAESVADAFCFLASPMASYMTGSTLLVDGGASLYPLD
jgi:NAD(P)-dependent dehydrogenase (short-subunit alcohol dehydrogenase family)